MKVIALTGGFSTGKSTVAQIFESQGIPRIDADTLTHSVCETHGVVWQKIVAEFGEDVLLADGGLDRPRLAEIIFNFPEKRKRLESIIHPSVLEKMNAEVKRCEKEGAKGVLLEIPLLFEAKWETLNRYDVIIVVTSTEALQIARAKKKLNLTKEEAKARIAAQLPLAEKAAKADHVIENTGDLATLHAKTKALFKKIFG